MSITLSSISPTDFGLAQVTSFPPATHYPTTPAQPTSRVLSPSIAFQKPFPPQRPSPLFYWFRLHPIHLYPSTSSGLAHLSALHGGFQSFRLRQHYPHHTELNPSITGSGKIDTPLPLNRRLPAIVCAGTALPISCYVIVSLFFNNTSHENVYQQLRRLGTIRRFPAPSSRHDGLNSGRCRLWRGFCSASRERNTCVGG